MTTCETLTHGTCVFLSQRHRFGTDAMLLADFCRPRRAEFAADLCGGCGIVALRWHDEGHRGTCVSVELNGEAHGLLAAALAAQPEAAQHIKAVHADLRTYAPAQAGQFHLAACNPPYFTGGHASPDPARAAARHEETCAFEDAAASAAPYVNVLAVKEGNEDNEAIQALVEALHSDTVRDYINNTYSGAVVPLF